MSQLDTKLPYPPLPSPGNSMLAWSDELIAHMHAYVDADRAQRAQPAKMLEPTQAENRRLRRMLCAARCPSAYMDDGAAQDNTELPFIDFMRQSLDEIEEALFERGAGKLREQGVRVGR